MGFDVKKQVAVKNRFWTRAGLRGAAGMNKKGMTLVELLVYMVLAALLLAPVVMLMQNASISMARDASSVSLRMSGRELLNIIYDDLKNTGYKLRPDFTADTAVSYYVDGASPKDYSSFMPGSKVGGGKFYDTLTVRVGRLNESGTALSRIDTISYGVDDAGGQKLLRRRIKNPDNAGTTTLARNVQALRFLYSENLADWRGDFIHTDPVELKSKRNVRYIKVIIVLKDNKRLSPVKPAPAIVLAPGDTLKPTDEALYERREIVVTIPNNGLFPPPQP